MKKSFEQWCIENNKKIWLKFWDYELNKCSPNEISYGTKKAYYFKCFNGENHSNLKNINCLTNNKVSFEFCKICNCFEAWCIKHKRIDILNLWDYKLNNKLPSEISCGTPQKYYFKCPKEIHLSELKRIDQFTRGIVEISCKYCNSFAQWGIDNLDNDFLKKYWDYVKNKISPWQINKATNNIKVWIKCQEKSYHGSYNIFPNNFVNGNKCPYCNKNSGKVHSFDSIGQLLEDKGLLDLWSDKNINSPYTYAPYCHKSKFYWKCKDNKHKDYLRSASASMRANFRCPECDYSKGEKRISKYLINDNYIKTTQNDYNELNFVNKIKNKYYIPQKEFEGLLGLGNGNLSYDFYLPQYNLLIEYQGQFHDGSVSNQTKKQLEYQQEHDRRKKEYADKNIIKLLEIWYWNYNSIEKF